LQEEAGRLPFRLMQSGRSRSSRDSRGLTSAGGGETKARGNDRGFSDEPKTESIPILPSNPTGDLPLLFEKDDEATAQTAAVLRPAVPAAVLPRSVEAHLDVLSGPGGQSSISITAARITLGRGRGADVCLQDMKVSSCHATIFYGQGEFRVRDEGSTNGTFLNRSRVTEYMLGHGDELLVGATRLRFRLVRRK
jgi:hypothetical protein